MPVPSRRSRTEVHRDPSSLLTAPPSHPHCAPSALPEKDLLAAAATEVAKEDVGSSASVDAQWKDALGDALRSEGKTVKVDALDKATAAVKAAANAALLKLSAMKAKQTQAGDASCKCTTKVNPHTLSIQWSATVTRGKHTARATPSEPPASVKGTAAYAPAAKGPQQQRGCVDLRSNRC